MNEKQSPELTRAVERVDGSYHPFVEVFCERCRSSDAVVSQTRYDEDAIRDALAAALRLARAEGAWGVANRKYKPGVNHYDEIEAELAAARAAIGDAR